jgi:hypothetical protein
LDENLIVSFDSLPQRLDFGFKQNWYFLSEKNIYITNFEYLYEKKIAKQTNPIAERPKIMPYLYKSLVLLVLFTWIE